MKTAQVFLFVTSIIITGILLFLFFAIPLPTIIPCTFPFAQDLFLALSSLLIIQVIVIPRFRPINVRASVFVLFPLLVFVIWLGYYPFSPLGFSNGRIPVLTGFVITKLDRPPHAVASGEIVTVVNDSIIEINPVTLPVNKSCFWVSAKGNGLDDPRSCDIAYFASSGADYDILKIQIRPSCRLPNTLGEIKLNILP
jgi:hypothetical protein